jgi:hypothetical protein
MTKPIINGFSEIAPLIIQEYERYLPSAFDGGMTMLQKVNKCIQKVNELGLVSNSVIDQWNEVMSWTMDEGLSQGITDKLNLMVNDGTFNSFINGTIFTKMNADLSAYNSRLTVQEVKKIGVTDITDELRNTIAGSTPIATTINDYSLNQRSFKYPLVKGVASKNIFDLTDITVGSFVVYSTGVLSVNASYSVSNYIPVSPNTQYVVSGSSEQLAFYTSAKVYISGLTSPGASLTTPANCSYVRLSMLNTQVSTVQMEAGANKTSYTSADPKIDVNSISDKIPETKLDLNRSVVRGTPSINLFNKEAITVGSYVANSNGLLVASAGYNVSDFIPIKPSTQYAVSGTSEQGAFYDSSKRYISGYTFSSSIPVSPSNAAFLRQSVKDAQLISTQVEEGTTATTFVAYGGIPSIAGVVQYVDRTVKPNGIGNYTSVKLANDAITDSSANKIYNLYIYPGTYTEFGYTLKPYINLIGINRKTCILKGEQPATVTETDIENNSTIWVNSTNNLENLTITAKNMRYAVHDESSGVNKDWVRNIKNCHIEHYGNEVGTWDSQCAYGCGISSGAKLYAENTTFKAPFAPFSVHNNVSFTKPAFVHLRGCKVEKVPGKYSYGLRVQSLGSGSSDVVMLEGCNLNASIFHNDSPWSGDANATTHIEWQLRGYGNTAVSLTSSFATGETDTLQFTV